MEKRKKNENVIHVLNTARAYKWILFFFFNQVDTAQTNPTQLSFEKKKIKTRVADKGNNIRQL